MSERVIIGIDPGPESSAWVAWDGNAIVHHGESANMELLLGMAGRLQYGSRPEKIVIEQIRGFGVIASDKLFDTCFWVGRFYQAWGSEICELLPRKKVIAHLCGTGAKGNDRFVREALIAKFGGEEKAIGNKKSGHIGPLYGIKGHKWAALAIAVTAYDLSNAEDVAARSH